MKNIIFIAPPAAGKGTQSDLLVSQYGFVHISTGDLLRAEVAKGTELGNRIKDTMAQGGLVDDDTVTTLLKSYLKNMDHERGFILDGYPRTLEQAEKLTDLLAELNVKIDYVLFLALDIETSMHRALGRITCPNCGRGYNKYEEGLKPFEDNICDDCHCELMARNDDTEEKFRTRFLAYEEKTKPLLDYYANLGILYHIDSSKTPEETFKQIESVIK